jgi:hypothetical protein
MLWIKVFAFGLTLLPQFRFTTALPTALPTAFPTAFPTALAKTTPSPSTDKPTSKVTASPSTDRPTSKSQAPTKTSGPTSYLHPAGKQILGYLVATAFTGDGKGVGEDLCNLPDAMPQSQVALATGVCMWSDNGKEYVMYNVTEIHANASTATTIHMTIDRYGADKLCMTSTSHKSIGQTLGCVAAGSGNLTALATDLPLGSQATYLSFNTGDSFPSFYFAGVVTASYPSKAACSEEADKPYRFQSAVADVCIPDAVGKTSTIVSCVSGSGFYTLTSFASSSSCSGQFSVSQKALSSPTCNADASSSYVVTGCGTDPFDFSYSSISGWLVKSTDVSANCNSPVSADFEPLGQCSSYSDELYALRTIEFKSASNATVITTTYSDSTCTADATPVSRVSVLLGRCYSNTTSSSKYFSYSYYPGGVYPTQAAISSGYGISKATSAADCTAQVNLVGYSILATNVCFMSSDGTSSFSYSCSNAQPVKKIWTANTQCAGAPSSATSITDNCFHGTGSESNDYYYNSFCSRAPTPPMVQGYYGESSYLKKDSTGACYGMTQQVYTALGLCTQYSGTKYSRSWYVRLGLGDALLNKTITYSSLANCQAGKSGQMSYVIDTSLAGQLILTHSCYQSGGFTSMFSFSAVATPPTATFPTEAFGLSAVPSQSQCNEQNQVGYLIYQPSKSCMVDHRDNSSLSVSCVGEGVTYYTAFPPNTFCNFTNAYNDVNIYVNGWPWQQTVSWNNPPCSPYQGDYITYFCGDSPKALLAEANKKAAAPISTALGYLEIKTFFYDEQQQHTDVDPVAPCTLDLPVKQNGVPVGLCLPFYPPSLDLSAQPLYFYIVSAVQDSASGISWKETYYADYLCATVSTGFKAQTVTVKSKACSPVGSSTTVYESVTYTPASPDASMGLAVLYSAASSIGFGTAVYNSGASCAGVQPSAYTSYSSGFCGPVQGGSVQYACEKTSLTEPPDALMRYYALSSNCSGGGYINVKINFNPNASLPLCLGTDEGAVSFFCNGFPVALPTDKPTPQPSPSPLRLPSFSPSLSSEAPTPSPASGSSSSGSLANEQDLTQSQIDGFAAGAAVVVVVLAILFYFRCRRIGAGSFPLASQDASSPGSPQRQPPSLARGGSANASNFGFAPRADHGAMRLSAGSVVSSRASDVIPNPVFEAAVASDAKSPHGDL